MNGLTALPYYGAANANSRSGIARWTAQILPRTDTYIELFGGMLGTLLQRPPVKNEIANDRHHIITNWWRQVRDRPDELARKLHYTPISAPEFYQLKHADWKQMDELEQARATTIILSHGYGNFGRIEWAQFQGKYYLECRTPIADIKDRLDQLADRLRHVTLLDDDATHLLRRLQGRTNAVVYADPPYLTEGRHKWHGPEELDVDEFTDAARTSDCHVIIQGRPGEWNHLDWPSYELPPAHRASAQAAPDILWANRPLDSGTLFQ